MTIAVAARQIGVMEKLAYLSSWTEWRPRHSRTQTSWRPCKVGFSRCVVGIFFETKDGKSIGRVLPSVLERQVL
jgi:hypothetical protein